jgi:hypothetical protein
MVRCGISHVNLQHSPKGMVNTVGSYKITAQHTFLVNPVKCLTFCQGICKLQFGNHCLMSYEFHAIPVLLPTNYCSMHYLRFMLTARFLLCTSRSISFSTYSMVRTLISPVCSSMYSSVRCVTVSPTTLSDSRTLVAPSLARRESFGKSSLEGRNVVCNYQANMGMGWLVMCYVLITNSTTYKIFCYIVLVTCQQSSLLYNTMSTNQSHSNQYIFIVSCYSFTSL